MALGQATSALRPLAPSRPARADLLQAVDNCRGHEFDASSLQRLQVCEQGSEVLGRGKCRRHATAGLERLRVGDPGGEVAAVIRERARRDPVGGREWVRSGPSVPPATVPRDAVAAVRRAR